MLRSQKCGAPAKSDSYVELRMLAWMTAGAVVLALALPSLLHAFDWNGDNLPDDWESQHGITTNAYAASNLVGWWQMESNTNNLVLDRTPNQINGAMTNFAASPYVPGLYSNALSFATNAQASFATNAALNTASSQFTFSTWFQSTNAPTQPATIATLTDTSTNSWSLLTTTNGAAYVSFANGTGGAQQIGPSTNAVQLYDGTWHQVAVTYDTNQAATVYVDGANEASGTVTNGTSGSVASFTMGVPSTNSINPSYNLDETRLYNRALKLQEILQLPPTYSDLNGSGLTVQEDYLEGLDPLSTNSSVTSAFVTSGLTGYYDNQVPSLLKVTGDTQLAQVGTFAANPLVVEITNGSGTALVNAPVTFSIPESASGELAFSSGGSTTTSISMTTDASGNAAIYYKAGTVLGSNTITATAVSAAGSAQVTFTIRNEPMPVGGLNLWLKSDDGVTQGSGSVSSWADQTGNYTATQATSANEPTYISGDVNGKPALRFNGSQWLYNSGSPNLNADLTIIVVGTTSNPSAEQYALWLGGYSMHGRSLGYRAGDQVFSPDSTSWLGAAAPTANTFTVEALSLDPSLDQVSFYRNGASTATASIGGLQSMASGITVGAYVGQFLGWQGDMAEVLVYDHQLSPSEYQQVDGYLADKYGLFDLNATWPLAYSSDVQAEIARNQWNKAQADNYVALQAANPSVMTDGLVTWFKADAGVTQSSGSVSAWADQAGNYTATQTPSANEPTYISSDVNGKPALRFNGSQWLYNARNLALNADMTIVVVGSTSNPSAEQYAMWLGGYSMHGRSLGYRAGDQVFSPDSTSWLGTSAPTANTFTAEAVSLNSALSQASFYRNGASVASSSIGGLQSMTPGVTVGAYVGQFLGWQGDIAEIMVYDHQLRPPEIQQVDGYLADKYGYYSLNATWPLAYSTTVQTQITANQWNKAQADTYSAFLATDPAIPAAGLQVWLNADAGVTADGGGKISQWQDQSPNGNNAVQTNSGNQPQLMANAISSHAVIHFNGSSAYLAMPRCIADDFTIMAVFRSSTQNGGGGQWYNSGGIVDGEVSGVVNDFGMSLDGSGELLTGTGNPDNSIVSSSGGFNNGSAHIATFSRVKASGLLSQYIDSALQGTLTNGTQTLDSPPRLTIGATQTLTGYYNGDVAEVVIYNRVLTASEQGQAEGYFADKFGIYASTATWPLAYSSDVQAQIAANDWTKAQADAYVAFVAANPTIPSKGLALWLKADTGVTADSYGNVSQWRDQSINANTVTQTASGLQPTLGTDAVDQEPTIQFNGSQRLVASSTKVPLDQDWTIITYGTSQDVNSERYMLSVGDGGVNGGLRAVGNSSSQNLVAFWSYATNVGPYLNQGELGVVETVYTKSSGQLTVYDRGVLAGSVSETLSATNSGLIVGDLTSGSYPRPWNGDIQEIFVYNRALSDTERQTIEGYLGDKYKTYSPYSTWFLTYSSAVQVQIVANQWNKAQADAYVAFLATDPPVPVEGLNLWLKADAGITASGGNVSQWTDQGPNQYSATQSNSSSQPSLVSNAWNGKPALQFSGGQTLQGIGNLHITANNGVTIVAMESTTAPGDQRYFVTAGGTSSAGQTRNMGYEGSQQTLSTSYHDIEGGDPAPNSGAFVVDATTLATDGSSITFYRNGVQTGTASTSGTGDVPSGFWVGSYVSNSINWEGEIGEILIYNRVLSSSEMSQAMGYLADKYGLYNPNATWPLAYSAYVQIQINANQWNKSQADAYAAFLASSPEAPSTGLQLWLKADAGVTADGSGNITQWVDQSSNAHTVTQSTSANKPQATTDSTTGLATVHFNGSQWLTGSDTIAANGDLTIVTVAEPDNTHNFTESISLGLSPSSTGTMRGYGYESGSPIFDVYQAAAQAGSAPQAGQSNITTMTYSRSSGALSFYSQGLVNGTTSQSVSDLISGLMIGGGGWQGAYWSGSISEMLVYDHVLSTADQQQAEGYLADKYGLYDVYATWPLAYGSGVQAEIVQHHWTKTQADSYVALQTDNPTVPTNGLSLWLRADAGVTSAGGQVSALVDQTGNYTLTQATSADQPTLVSNALNGKPAIQFNGSQALGSTASVGPGLNRAMTLVTVAMTTAPNSQGYSLYLGQGGGSMGTNRAIGCDDAQIFDISTAYLGGVAPPASKFVAEMVTLDSTATNLSFYRNGILTAAGTISGVQNLSSGITLGSAPGLAGGWKGQIAEELVYDHQLSSAEIQQVGAYLAAKYNLPLSGTGPAISPNGGSFTSTQSVTLSASSYPGAVIHYTLDGTIPTLSSPTYSSSLSISASALVSAAAFSASDGTQLSGVSSAQFYVNDPGSTGAPTAASDLTVTPISPTEIDLSWGLSGLVNYSTVDVYRSSDGGATYQLIVTLSASTTSFDDANVQAGTNYQYYIQTSNSSASTQTTASSPTAPSVPGGLTIIVTTPSGATSLP